MQSSCYCELSQHINTNNGNVCAQHLFPIINHQAMMKNFFLSDFSFHSSQPLSISSFSCLDNLYSTLDIKFFGSVMTELMKKT